MIWCAWCEDGPPTWEDAFWWWNYDPNIKTELQALQRLRIDYAYSVCPRTKMRHLSQEPPYQGLRRP